jgi:hypothetical protein
MTITSLVVTIMNLIWMIERVVYGAGTLLVLCGLGISIFGMVMGIMHLNMQFWLISRNLTSVEYTKQSFSWSRMTHFEVAHDFAHPFDRRSVRANFEEIFGKHILLWLIPVNTHQIEQAYSISPDQKSMERFIELEEQVESIVSLNLREAGLIA